MKALRYRVYYGHGFQAIGQYSFVHAMSLVNRGKASWIWFTDHDGFTIQLFRACELAQLNPLVLMTKLEAIQKRAEAAGLYAICVREGNLPGNFDRAKATFERYASLAALLMFVERQRVKRSYK